MAYPEGNNSSLRTPVVFLIFNRPEPARKVFEAIRQARPAQLLVVADGPRSSHQDDQQLCLQSRALLNLVDWPCQVYTNFADTNMGCRRRIVSGLNWAFDQVEEAIILEDDCLPDPTFFRYCSELLEHYRDEPRIGQISGANFQPPGCGDGYSYYYSRYNHIWGWASWRRAWRLHDDTMKDWPGFRDGGGLKKLISSAAERRYWIDILDRIAAGQLDTWDCQWTLSCWQNRMLTVLPQVNLVSNIGFGPAATHTTVSCRFAALPTSRMTFPLKHPGEIIPNHRADAHDSRRSYRPLSFWRKLAIIVGRRV